MTIATSNHGTAFSDGVRIGSYRSAYYDFGVPGISESPRICYAIKPGQDSFIYNAAISGAGAIVLNPVAPATFVTYQGYNNVVKLDVCRGLVIEVNTLGSPQTLTISGWDIWGHKVVEDIALSDTGIFHSNKTYSHIKSIYSTGAVPSIEIGTSRQFGLPFYAPIPSFCRFMWNNRPDYCVEYIGESGSTLALEYTQWPGGALKGGNAGSGFNPGDATTPATATTGDPRGFFAPSGSPTGAAWLMVVQYVPAFDPMYGTVLSPSISAPSTAYAYGVPQYSTGWQ